MKKKITLPSTLSNRPAAAGIFVILTAVFVALLAAANPPTRCGLQNERSRSGTVAPARVTTRTLMRVTSDGVVRDHSFLEARELSLTLTPGQGHLTAPRGNTLWSVDDPNAIADGVSIDANNVWGAWILSGARLS